MKKSEKTTRFKPSLLSVILLLFVVMIVALLGWVSYIRSKPLKIEFFEHAEVNVNEAVDTYQFIKSIENGKILTEKMPIDTSKAGEKRISLTVKPLFEPETVFSYSVSIVDRESPNITFTDHLKTEVGNEIDLLKGVYATDNSNEEITVTVEGVYDIKTVGDYPLKYVAYDSSLNKTEEDFILSVEDHESPVITFADHLECTRGEEIDLLEGVSATDNSNESIRVTVEGTYDFHKAGVYVLKYVAYDSSMNKAEETFILQVNEIVPPAPDKKPNDEPVKWETVTFTTSKGFSGVTKDGVTYIDGYLIANKTYSLPSTYGNGLTGETQSAFYKMSAAAKEDGLNIYISSGFRSYSRQKTIYSNYVKRDGAAVADTYSARAGHSEHQSGLAFDVNIISDAFIGTPEAIWLHDNCYKYGFILRYPQGKTDETGYKYEPWHFRYVGTELAAKLYNDGDWITMEDYFGITSEYPS